MSRLCLGLEAMLRLNACVTPLPGFAEPRRRGGSREGTSEAGEVTSALAPRFTPPRGQSAIRHQMGETKLALCALNPPTKVGR